MRNLTKTIAAVSLLAPVSAYPLGIGDIKLHSALNQNLNAEIALLVSAGEKISDLKVRLAPPEKFDEAGVPWNYFLSKIKFDAVVRGDGSSIVKVSSDEALREPFLDFLLEVTWAKGSLYREFTVLVDPPAAYTQPVIPIQQQAQQVTVTSQAPAKLSTVEKHEGTSAPEYVSTHGNDSLWKVAERTNTHSDVSIEQMMMALYQANPKAFYKDNVNALMAGKTLTIPEREVILQLSKAEASTAFKRQNDEWSGRVSEQSKAESTDTEEVGIATQLELEAPVEAEIGEQVVVGADAEPAADYLASLDTDETMAIPTTEEGRALQGRVEKLQQQLQMMQKMLLLKDKQIAALQSQGLEAPAAEIDQAVTEESKTQQTTEPLKEPKAAVEAVAPAPEKKAPPKKTEPKVKKEKEPESGFMSDPMMLTLGGSGIAILIALGWFLWRRQQIEEQTNTESMFAAASEISLPDSSIEGATTPVDDTTAYDVGTVGESSFLSEFTPSDFDAFDTDQNEVDPISEADVYLAYGRYQQAEDLMREAIADQPERDECKLKLLEIFYANENKSAFEEYANELISSGKHNDQDFWSKVIEMGSELDPESALYSEQGAANKATFVADDLDSEDEEKPAGDFVSDDASDDFDLSVFDEPDVDKQNAEIDNKVDEADLDFDLSVFDETPDADDQDKTNVVSKQSENELETVDFDLDSVSLEEVSEKKDAESARVEDDLESFDFDFDTDAPEKEEKQGEIDLSAENDEIEKLDFSLDVAEPEQEEKSEKIEDFDFDFDLDTPPSKPDASTTFTAEVADLTDMDELETKIDLAKAYIDMGDEEAAKSIAEEVLEKGNAEQKKTAQSILEQLK